MKINKILCVVNKPTREIPIFQQIEKEILKIDPECNIKIIEYRDKDFLFKSIQYNPDITITFPFTSITTSQPFYLLKFFTNTLIISYRTEGAISFYSKKQIKWLVGMEHYDENLVDLEIFWGEKTASIIGKELILQKKLKSKNRIKVTGYPPFEVFLNENVKTKLPELPNNYLQKIRKFPKDKVYLFITGFHLADYTVEELINAGDLFDTTKDYKEELAEAIEGVEKAKKFREQYIKNILLAAQTHKDILFIVKPHPIELIIHKRKKLTIYDAFQNVENILFVNDELQITDLFPYISLFFHYGSTALAFTYLLKVPSVFISSKEIYNCGKDYSLATYFYTDMGWESNDYCDIKNLSEKISEYKKQNPKFYLTKRMKEVLFDVFNVTEDNLNGKVPYKPSEQIAKIIFDLEKNNPLLINVNSEFFIRAIKNQGVPLFEKYFAAAENFLSKGELDKAIYYYDELIYFQNKLSIENNLLILRYAELLMKQGFIYLARNLLYNKIIAGEKNPELIRFAEKISKQILDNVFNDFVLILNETIQTKEFEDIYRDFVRREFSKTIDEITNLFSLDTRNNSVSEFGLNLLEGFSLLFLGKIIEANKKLEKTLSNFSNSFLPLLGLLETELLQNQFNFAKRNCEVLLNVVSANYVKDLVLKKLDIIEMSNNFLENHRGIASILNKN